MPAARVHHEERAAYEIEIVRRTRLGGGIALPGKKYPCTKTEFFDAIRSRKGVDPEGEYVAPRPVGKKALRERRNQETRGGKGESAQTVGTRTVPEGSEDDEPKKGRKAASKASE